MLQLKFHVQKTNLYAGQIFQSTVRGIDQMLVDNNNKSRNLI